MPRHSDMGGLGRRSQRKCTRMLLCASVLLITGCGQPATGSTPNAGPPQGGGTIVIGVSREPAIINPWLAQGAMAITWQLTDGLSEPLVQLDEQGTWQPVLAEQVPTRDNGGVTEANGIMQIRVRIRQAAAWSDGVPLRCEDVKFTWRTVTDPRVLMSNRLGWDAIKRIDCPTPRDVVITMKRPYALFMSRILQAPPLPRHELEGKDFNTYWNDRITVSSGPFRFVEWKRGVRFVLERNPRYWNADGAVDLGAGPAPERGGPPRPYADRVVFRFVKDANTLKMQLRMTEADVAMIPADTNLSEELSQTPDTGFAAPPGALVEMLAMNTARAPLDDVRVRRAIAYAIDREMIARVVLKDQVPVLQSSLVPTQPAYVSSPFSKYAPNASRVRDLLTEAGFERSGTGLWNRNGTPLQLEYVAAAGSYPFRMRVGQLLQQQLEAQGIGMSIQLVTPEVLYSEVAPKGRYHLGEWSEITGNEPAPALLFTCDAIPRKPQFAGKNRFRYCNRELDALIAQADATVDVSQRGNLIRQIDRHVADALPIVPLFQSPDTIAWNTRIRGIVPNPPSFHTWNIDEWWTTDARAHGGAAS
jgi:peptide/nickel transport system substrate-binding protein